LLQHGGKLAAAGAGFKRIWVFPDQLKMQNAKLKMPIGCAAHF
jgi:hypothetical protein